MHPLRRAFAALAEDRNKSRRSLWPLTVFLISGIIFFGYRAINQSDIAARQKISAGIVSQCEVRGRGNDNYCHYTFPIGDEIHTGLSQAEPDTNYGQTVTVYYDYEHPDINALMDFSKQSRTSRHFVYLLSLALVAVAVFVTWDRAP